MERNIFEDFIGQYSLSKTLRFELCPQGRTQEYIEARGIIGEDEVRDQDYTVVKNVIDEYHKKFMERTLKQLKFKGLEEYCELLSKREKSEKENKDLEKQEENLRKQVVDCFKSDEKYNLLFKCRPFIKEELPAFVDDETARKAVENFQNFTTYFQGFFENRKNMYSAEAKSTAAAYRIVNQNLPRFLDNKRVFDLLQETELSNSIYELEEQYADILEDKPLKAFFEIQNYSHMVTNNDIELYNGLIGGRTLTDGRKIKGINEYVNEYNQVAEKAGNRRRIPKLKPLYKQILADRESLSVTFEPFTEDGQLIDAVREFVSNLSKTVLCRESSHSLPALLEHIGEYCLDGIFIKNGPAITELSNRAYGDWSVLKSCLEKEYDTANGKKNRNEKYFEERARKLKQRGSYSLGELNRAVEEYGGLEGHLEQVFACGRVKDEITLWDAFDAAYKKANALLYADHTGKHELAGNKKGVALLKELLDCIKNVENFVKPLLGTGIESGKDDNFYGELDVLYAQISQITPLYNKVRNYVTKKPYSVEKVKINFQNPTLLNGWDVNKERDNLAVILRKDGLYYLGIMDKNNNKVFMNKEFEETGSYYEKVEYKLLPGPNKMLPKVFFGKSNLDIFHPSEEILRNYEKGSHKLGDTFNLKECHQLINFFKDSIAQHEDWCKFGFQFSDTEEYRDISQFYHEVEKQGYSLKFRKIPENYIDQLVEDGKLYLFQIYNKDFSPYAKGTPNLHTLYWKMLFDERNLRNVVYKLNGEAEIFYRKASIATENQVVHPKGQPIAKKNLKAVEKGETSLFSYDLIKDRRYTVDKYQFHVPITMNFCAEGKSNLNGPVQDVIRRERGINVIGIDRGERNLLYLCVVSPEGRILHQQSLNLIENDKGYEQNYHALLDAKEKAMNQARRDWMEINSIKELKEGYLSQAIHKITELMLKYQAVLVLEDLNFGFINGRKKVGKQVYQKFEKMLIDKLNYLVDKKIDPEQPGGTLKAYQMTSQFESFAKLGRQSGFLFYIQAWNTSKIDPTTGFVNLLSVKYTSMKEAKAFLEKFDYIRYNVTEGYFEFALDYKKFTDRSTGIRTNWVLCSKGTRIVNFRNPEKNSQWDAKEVDLTEQMRKHFEQYGVNLSKENMTDDICKVEQAQFFQDLLGDIRLMVQMRNSMPNSEIDYMLSPVKNENGGFFDTRTYQADDENYNYFPQDADANGAYNIARKGLMVLERIRQEEKAKLAISNQEWLEYAQQHPLLQENGNV